MYLKDFEIGKVFTMIATLSSVALLSACSGPSSEELKEAQSECARFYKEKRAKYYSDVSAVDHWNKNGKLVIELAIKDEPSSRSYTSGLCLYDKEKGTIEIPGLFEQARWAK